MSYNNRADNFTVTSGRDGGRSFSKGHNVRFTHGSNYRGSRGRGGGGTRGPRRPNYRNVSSSRYRYVRGGNDEDNEGDISMSGDSSRGRGGRSRPFRSHRGRGNSRRGANHQNYNMSASNNAEWFKVMVPFGNEISQAELLSLIRSNLDDSFELHQYSTDERRAYFYVRGSDTAGSLRAISRRLTRPSGQKLVFHVSPAQAPIDTVLPEAHKERLMVRMSDRYDPATQLLDLGSFYSDSVLSAEGIHIALNRKEAMNAVIKIVSEHIPELSGLDLKNNRLRMLRNLKDLVKGAPNVKSLNLADNHISNIEELNPLRGWTDLSELVLEGNDLCKSFKNKTAYVSAVRKVFPKVLRLDGTEYPPPITFDLDTNVKLPESKGSYFVNENIKNLVVTFIKEYYTIYDSDRRRDLIPAYHENAMMSVCTSFNPMFEKQPKFLGYFDGNRNLVKMMHIDPDKLVKRVHCGNLRVMTQLESMPKTNHDIKSFKVDVSVASPKLLKFVLHGVFREENDMIRTFSRSFVTIPSGSGMVITNDMLQISNAGYEQRRNAFKDLPEAASVNNNAVPAIKQELGVPPAASASSAPFLTPEQIQMVERFMKDSAMNSSFSLKCLQENLWNYERAGQVFTELHSQGKIPTEAFVKDER